MSGAGMIKTLLVANRGEIAVRILRTAHRMGVSTVAVYSQADAGAMHVELADQAVCIGGSAPADSYLRVDQIIAAAQATGADAVHPGYGFLAENPALAQACAAAGLIFVGPSARAMRDMGDKAAAKALMKAAGVPCVPGYQGDQTPERLAQEADKLGYPVMIKATAGGGGRGMRLVQDTGAFMAALQSAKSEAMAGFGDDTVLLEKAIQAPRHIEIQVMADQHGTAVHLGERDCSVQRRHQKLIEEAPSPAVTPALREQMGAAALRAVQEIGYVGAGTLEFLLDADGRFYFMEMNTRLQVEHPVTEAITGLDLVELQLRVASGQPLGLRQEDIRFDGHAIEVRLCAEDAENGFLPQSGRMLRWGLPAGLRVDHALHDGAEVSGFYDSMLAKIVAHGPDRDSARARLVRGVSQTCALGLRTNQGMLAGALRHPVFTAEQATTGFVADNGAELLDMSLQSEAALRVAVLSRARFGGLAHGYPTPVRLLREEEAFDMRLTCHARGQCVVEQGDQRVEITALGPDLLEVAGVQERAQWLRDGDMLWLHWRGRAWDFQDASLSATTSAARSGDGKLRAAMNGRVRAVHVAPGDEVQQGQPLLVLEAMKMEHSHLANRAGTVAAVHVGAEDQVTAQQLLIEITDPG